MYLCHGTDGRGQRLLQQAAGSEQSRSVGEPRRDLLAAKYPRSSEWYVQLGDFDMAEFCPRF